MPDDEELREELARALHASDHGGTWDLLWEELPDGPDLGRRYYYRLAAALLPVVERYAARRAAEALREAAKDMQEVADSYGRWPFRVDPLGVTRRLDPLVARLRACADALDGEP